MKLTLKREGVQLILVASMLDAGPTAFIGAVYQCARGDKPIKYTLRNGLGDSKVCDYDQAVLENARKQHANQVAAMLSVELELQI